MNESVNSPKSTALAQLQAPLPGTGKWLGEVFYPLQGLSSSHSPLSCGVSRAGQSHGRHLMSALILPHMTFLYQTTDHTFFLSGLRKVSRGQEQTPARAIQVWSLWLAQFPCSLCVGTKGITEHCRVQGWEREHTAWWMSHSHITRRCTCWWRRNPCLQFEILHDHTRKHLCIVLLHDATKVAI
jgi:hypothetical protein